MARGDTVAKGSPTPAGRRVPVASYDWRQYPKTTSATRPIGRFLSGIGAALAGSMANKSSIVIDLRGWENTVCIWRGTVGPRKVRPTVHGGNREGPASAKGLNSQRGFGPAVKRRRKSRPRSTSVHGSSPCKCQRLSTLRWDRLPSSRPPTKSGARAGGRRLSDRRLHR